VFYDIKPGTSHNLRFLPPWNEEGLLFFESVQHFNFKVDGQPRAFACLKVHGDGECPSCDMLERAPDVFAGNDDLIESILNKHGLAFRWHAQVIPIRPEGLEQDGPYIVGLSKGTANDVSDILTMERDNRQALLVDPDEGQAINITRNNKSGLGTRYKVMPTGLRVGLDDLLPDWADKFLDVPKAVNLRIITPEDMYKAIQDTRGNNIFAKLFPEIDV
jgi:hypothetical protein